MRKLNDIIFIELGSKAEQIMGTSQVNRKKNNKTIRKLVEL